jgi:hypothetical protein
MLIYLFFWYVILILWARRSLPFNWRTWVTRRFIRAHTSIIILALLIARHNWPTGLWGFAIYFYKSGWVSNFVKKHRKKKLLSVRVAELTAFQRSKVLEVDDDTYPIISLYRDFSLKRHEAYRHSSELVSESIQMKLCCFFLLDIFMRDLNLLSWTQSKT